MEAAAEITPVEKYERLDIHINKILNSLDSFKENCDAYFDEAAKQGLTLEEAKKYLLTKVPKTTFYRYLPDEYKDTR